MNFGQHGSTLLATNTNGILRVLLRPGAVALLTAGLTGAASMPSASPAIAQATPARLPAPPANGVMSFVVEDFTQPVIQGKDACPGGLANQLSGVYLDTLPPAERARLKLKENANEFDRKWKAYAFGPGGTNVCAQPDMFERPPLRTVQSKFAWGLDLDDGDTSDTCAHQSFTTPAGEKGIDNQEYRAMGCTIIWRGIDGIAGDQEVGQRQYHVSGQWTQVIVLRGVDSLVRDDDVEVIYANTPDRPIVDSGGKFLRGASFTVSDTLPRHRNALRGRIANGVLTTETKDILLSEASGGGPRGVRQKFDFRKARLRLTFQSDGSVTGMLGGYRPIFDPIKTHSYGGAGSAVVAGIDCASELATLRRMADGIKDPKTGQCSGVSSAVRIRAIPAFVNDVPPARTAAR